MQKKSELALRLKSLRRQKGVTSQAVADAIGIKSATYRRYEIDTKPKDEAYIALADYFGVSVDYLMSGRDRDNVTTLNVADPDDYYAEPGITEDEADLIRKLRTLNKDDFQEVISFVEWKCTSEHKN